MKNRYFIFWILLFITINNAVCFESYEPVQEYLEICDNKSFDNLQKNFFKFALLSKTPCWKRYARNIVISMMDNWSVSIYQSSGVSNQEWNIHYIILTNIETRASDGRWVVNHKIERQGDLPFPSDTGKKVNEIYTKMLSRAKYRQVDKSSLGFDGSINYFTTDIGTNDLHGVVWSADAGLAWRLVIIGGLLFKYCISSEGDRKECLKEINQKSKEYYSKKLWKEEYLPEEEYNKLIWKNGVAYRSTTNELYESGE